MEIIYRKSESATDPALLDASSSKTTVYIRRNIQEKQRTDEDGEQHTYYEYEEAKLTRKEWREYQKELEFLDIRQQRADIDYIACMIGVDLEESNEQNV